MGFACPVCETPQADAEHLANHLAFTAMLGDDAHGSWLDERVPDWRESGPNDLAPAVVEYADETDYPQVFEDTTVDHDHGEGVPDTIADASSEATDAETREVLAEARELTRRMFDEDESE